MNQNETKINAEIWKILKEHFFVPEFEIEPVIDEGGAADELLNLITAEVDRALAERDKVLEEYERLLEKERDKTNRVFDRVSEDMSSISNTGVLELQQSLDILNKYKKEVLE
jgi:hypothetical protein